MNVWITIFFSSTFFLCFLFFPHRNQFLFFLNIKVPCDWARYLDEAREKYFFYTDDIPTLRLFENEDDNGTEIREQELWRPLGMSSQEYEKKIQVNKYDIQFCGNLYFQLFLFCEPFCWFFFVLSNRWRRIMALIRGLKKLIILTSMYETPTTFNLFM